MHMFQYRETKLQTGKDCLQADGMTASKAFPFLYTTVYPSHVTQPSTLFPRKVITSNNPTHRMARGVTGNLDNCTRVRNMTDCKRQKSGWPIGFLSMASAHSNVKMKNVNIFFPNVLYLITHEIIFLMSVQTCCGKTHTHNTAVRNYCPWHFIKYSPYWILFQLKW